MCITTNEQNKCCIIQKNFTIIILIISLYREQWKYEGENDAITRYNNNNNKTTYPAKYIKPIVLYGITTWYRFVMLPRIFIATKTINIKTYHQPHKYYTVFLSVCSTILCTNYFLIFFSCLFELKNNKYNSSYLLRTHTNNV